MHRSNTVSLQKAHMEQRGRSLHAEQAFIKDGTNRVILATDGGLTHRIAAPRYFA